MSDIEETIVRVFLATYTLALELAVVNPDFICIVK
jgi:hypothetical protein